MIHLRFADPEDSRWTEAVIRGPRTEEILRGLAESARAEGFLAQFRPPGGDWENWTAGVVDDWDEEDEDG